MARRGLAAYFGSVPDDSDPTTHAADMIGQGHVLAKTSTAEFGTRPPLPAHAWMIASQGDLAVAVFADVGESGSQTAGPIPERFLRG